MPNQKQPAPLNLPPVIRRLFEIMALDPRPQGDVLEAAGAGRSTLHNWRHRCGATVGGLEAVLNVLGHRLAVVPADVTDEEVAAALTVYRRGVARQDCAPKPDPTPSVGHKTRQADTPLSAYISDEIML